MTSPTQMHALSTTALTPVAEAPVQTVEASQQNEAAKRGWFKNLRTNAIHALPAPMVNHSSNWLGFTHVLTEIAMMQASAAKSGGLFSKDAKLHEYPKILGERIWNDNFIGSMPKTKPADLFKDGHGPVGAVKNYFNGEKAAEREYARYGSAKGSLGNRWQARSTLFGLGVWTLSTVIPDKKENPEEVERMAVIQQESPIKYVGERLKQAVWMPGWSDHKRQMIGLGVTLSGICSGMGGWRRRSAAEDLAKLGKLSKDFHFPQVYRFEWSYFTQSLFTLGSGLALLFSLDDERGYSRMGLGMMGRLAFLPITIADKYGHTFNSKTWRIDKTKPEDGRGWYLGSTISFQLENMAQALIGGAEKNPDGTIVDHASIRKEAKLKAQIKVNARKLGEPITDEEAELRLKKIHDAHPVQHLQEGSSLVSDVPDTKVSAITAGKALPAPTNDNELLANDNERTHASQEMQRRAEMPAAALTV